MPRKRRTSEELDEGLRQIAYGETPERIEPAPPGPGASIGKALWSVVRGVGRVAKAIADGILPPADETVEDVRRARRNRPFRGGPWQ